MVGASGKGWVWYGGVEVILPRKRLLNRYVSSVKLENFSLLRNARMAVRL
jgi:hypothetical protein